MFLLHESSGLREGLFRHGLESARGKSAFLVLAWPIFLLRAIFSVSWKRGCEKSLNYLSRLRTFVKRLEQR